MEPMETTIGSGMGESGTEQRQTRRINVGRTERQASMIGGAALALSGLSQLKHRHVIPGLAMIAAGGMLVFRGKTGHCSMYQKFGFNTAGTEDNGITVEKVLTINRPPQEVYDFWHNLENLPRFMQHLDSVQVTGAGTSHWKARGPLGMTVEWDAETLEDFPGHRISWRSTRNADIPNEGTVQFQEAPGGRGTELKVNLTYQPPGVTAGKAAARVAHSISSQQIEQDLKRLKQILETGETATARMSPAGRTVH